MRELAADLHIHTALSPCAAEEMTPPAIVEAAVRAGLDMIAICDHNSAGNVLAVQEAAAGSLAVLAGIEITTAEEVHVLGWFPGAAQALKAARAVLRTLPRGRTPTRGFGVQRLMDSAGRTTGVERAMLSAASTFALSGALELVREHGGLAVASHVDRPSFSVLGQLGVMPQDARFDAIELSPAGCKSGRAKEFAELGLPMVCSSDSHSLAEVGTAFSVLRVQEASFEEVALSLAGRDGREVARA